jgi:hypothetical protein
MLSYAAVKENMKKVSIDERTENSETSGPLHGTRRRVAAGPTMSTLAEDLDGYLRARADVEGVCCELSPEFFAAFIKAGVASFFGIDVDLANGVLVRIARSRGPDFSRLG